MMDGNIRWTNRASGNGIDLDILKRKSWNGAAAHFVRIPAPITYDFELSSALNYVIHFDVYRTDGESVASGAPPSFSKDLRGKLAFIPEGTNLKAWHKIDKSASMTIVALDNVSFGERPFDTRPLEPLLHFTDPMLRSLMLRFQALLDDSSLDVPGYAETLAELLRYELVRVSTADESSRSAARGLTASQMRQVVDYMDAHLNEKVMISDLADLVGLTRFHFIRAFRHAAGKPPHQYIIRRRVERAREMLTEQPHTSVAEVADRTGFTPVQMTRAFRRIVGTTPTGVRRSMP